MINAMTLQFIKAHFLDVRPLSDLVNVTLSLNGFGRLLSQPFGYVIIRVQVEGVWGYDKDQMALVVPNPADFGYQVPVILGTQTIN